MRAKLCHNLIKFPGESPDSGSMFHSVMSISINSEATLAWENWQVCAVGEIHRNASLNTVSSSTIILSELTKFQYVVKLVKGGRRHPIFSCMVQLTELSNELMIEANFSGDSDGSEYFINQNEHNLLAKKLNFLGCKQCFCTLQHFSSNTILFVSPSLTSARY